jgi:uncharacterized membrane protein (UPF0127 family)
MRFLVDSIVIFIIAATALFVYQNYWDTFVASLFTDEPVHTVYIGSSAIAVTVADSDEERKQGLSGVRSLREREGKLFIFDTNDRHGIWMKDMLMPLDIIWIDENLQIVHYVENVSPESFPEVFTPPSDARFVLEMNAHFVASLRTKVGDRLTLPSVLLPEDIKQNLQD